MKTRQLLCLTAIGALLFGLPALAAHAGHGGGGSGYQGGGNAGGNYGQQSGGNYGRQGGGSYGQQTGGHQDHHGGGNGSFGHGGNAQWGDFQHHENAVRVYPHRFQGTVFPTPRRWQGDIHNFEHDHWHGGEWRHVNHGGRWGWWWVVGPSWYFYDQPIYPYPDSYTPPGEVPGWWYWCDAYQEYYPYVTICPSGWQRVLPRD